MRCCLSVFKEKEQPSLPWSDRNNDDYSLAQDAMVNTHPTASSSSGAHSCWSRAVLEWPTKAVSTFLLDSEDSCCYKQKQHKLIPGDAFLYLGLWSSLMPHLSCSCPDTNTEQLLAGDPALQEFFHRKPPGGWLTPLLFYSCWGSELEPAGCLNPGTQRAAALWPSDRPFLQVLNGFGAKSVPETSLGTMN